MNPPSALYGAMNKERKPFTYTPGGLDLSEIKSERMAKRLMRNAMNQGVPEVPIQQIQSPPATSNPIAVPNFNCLPVQVFPTFSLPANPKSLLRTRSNPDNPKDQIQKTPLQTPTLQLNKGDKKIIENNKPSYQRPVSMYDHAIVRNSTKTISTTNYDSNEFSAPELPEISYEAEYFQTLPTNNYTSNNMPLLENNTNQITLESNGISFNKSKSQIEKECDIKANINETSTTVNFKSMQSTTKDLDLKTEDVKLSINDTSIENIDKESNFKTVDLDIDIKSENGILDTSDNPINLEFSVKPISVDTFATTPSTPSRSIEEQKRIDDEQKQVKVVKKQVKKESTSEVQNGGQNGNADTEAELTVKLPTKKSAAKTETNVEVVKKHLPDGSIEEVKTTTTKTTVDGKTTIATKTETTIIPKQEEEEFEEEIEEEEEEESGVVQEIEDGEEKEEVKEVIVKKTTEESKPVVENGDKVITNEERSETKTTMTKKVTVVQKEQSDEEDVEEEEEEVEETNPEVVKKSPITKQESTKEEENEDEEEEAEEEIVEKKQEQKKVEVIEKEEEEVEEEEEEEIVEVKKQEVPSENEEEDEGKNKVEKPVKPEEKPADNTKEDDESEYTEEEYESEKEEVTKPESKQVSEPEKSKIEETKEEPKEQKDEEKPFVKSAPEPTIQTTQPSSKPAPQSAPEPTIQTTQPSSEPAPQSAPEPTIQTTQPPSQPASQPAPQPESKIPAREPSIPLEKVEDVEIKPIAPVHESITKTHTKNTEIITSARPSGPLSTQTEYNKFENIVTVNRTTKTLDQTYQSTVEHGVPTVKTYFAPTRERISTSPSKPYQPVYSPVVNPPSERRHSLLLERLSVERQIPTSDNYQNNYQTFDQQPQWNQEPQAEVLTVSNVKPSKITNQQWYQQSKKDNIYTLPTAPVSQPWKQPPLQQTVPSPQPPSQIQPQVQPTYQPSYTENTTNTYQQNTYQTYTPKPTTWETSTLNTTDNLSSTYNTQSNQYSLLNKNSTESYQKTTQQYSSSYVPPPWEQDSSYVDVTSNQNQYQVPSQNNQFQPPPLTSNFAPSTNQGWTPAPPKSKYAKPPPTAYIPPAPNQSFVKSVNSVETQRSQPGKKTYYSEYERRYITVPESTYVPSETKPSYQPQPDPSPQYYYDNNEPVEPVEPQWRKELREFTEKTSQTQHTEQISVKPPWEEDPKYEKAPSSTYTPTPTWSQTLRPRSWRERSFESDYVGSQEAPKNNTLGRGRPVSSYGTSNIETIPERPRGVSVDRYNPNIYQTPISTEHPPVQTHILNVVPPAKSYHNPSVPAYHTQSRASAEPREQTATYQQPRHWADSRASPLQSRSFKYLQWITGTDN